MVNGSPLHMPASLVVTLHANIVFAADETVFALNYPTPRLTTSGIT